MPVTLGQTISVSTTNFMLVKRDLRIVAHNFLIKPKSRMPSSILFGEAIHSTEQ